MAMLVSQAVTPFKAPATSFAGVAPEAAALVVATAADVAVILD